jgi:hypothetical protein
MVRREDHLAWSKIHEHMSEDAIWAEICSRYPIASSMSKAEKRKITEKRKAAYTDSLNIFGRGGIVEEMTPKFRRRI